MPAIFDALPGQEVPVGRIADGFTRLWADSPARHSRAVQLNLVLHLGRQTTPDDARAQFDHTLRFAQRSPCRVVVLCPDFDPAAPPELRAKLHGECFAGRAAGDTRCVEFVLLHYTLAARAHLENQVSVCLSTDLPLYYWAHAFSAVSRLADYHRLLTRSARVLFDSAVVPSAAFDVAWPRRDAVRDLAYTRTRPLRQGLGQFLSRYAPAALVAGLRGARLSHAADLAAEAAGILDWVRKGLARAGAGDEARLTCALAPAGPPARLALAFDYADPAKSFAWTADLAAAQADFAGDLGHGRTTLTAGAHLLEPAAALGEAIFA